MPAVQGLRELPKPPGATAVACAACTVGVVVDSINILLVFAEDTVDTTDDRHMKHSEFFLT